MGPLIRYSKSPFPSLPVSLSLGRYRVTLTPTLTRLARPYAAPERHSLQRLMLPRNGIVSQGRSEVTGSDVGCPIVDEASLVSDLRLASLGTSFSPLADHAYLRGTWLLTLMNVKVNDPNLD